MPFNIPRPLRAYSWPTDGTEDVEHFVNDVAHHYIKMETLQDKDV